ncbi:hypothetical protein VOLCADRAFT_92403 [Volvox carteri f. nagariensis]|uniref:Uncharacterized protein n=1 Tax=Volvox carteri f. nagariensis TaxID=3068 RepID=D8TZK5_VOLCA|nr:uncharacterized protein VOLCADRAFT_92403 [Volvox carteri f. nagariensis]EFJ46942.1 hypothetical protein VOLCADRAFT_92403 [Volvox carteri f. nagariensis]|eukprot:XP_002951837.1 hypothetical protein VOLCADRAFT_92403 [Volvox carteri f. nagariensis]
MNRPGPSALSNAPPTPWRTATVLADRVFDIYYNVLDGSKPPCVRRRSNTSGGSSVSGGSTASNGGSGAGGSRGSMGSGSRKRAPETDKEDTVTGTQHRPVRSGAGWRAPAVAGIGSATSGMAALGLTEAGMSLDDDDYCVIVE